MTWWQAGLLAVSLGLALAGLGFNITHDANHGSYSPQPAAQPRDVLVPWT